jgi:cytochrome c oxidase accessory protein FixG
MGNSKMQNLEHMDHEPTEDSGDQPLYVGRKRIHPKLVHGFYRNLKWLVLAMTLAVYYMLPWLRLDRGPNAPDQALLFDFVNRKFYIFWLEFWPQEVFYLTGVLIISALLLFLLTSLFGRVWCGYTCPQTVWTDLFIFVERLVEGDRNARIKLDRSPMGFGKFGRRALKHFIWVLIAIATGGAFVFYFRDAPTLAMELLDGSAPLVAYVFVGIFAATTYLLGGLAREQVCIYMCPWPRIQGAMFDENSLLVTYKDYRGEPRGKHHQGDSWDGRGDCIDCKQCVVVCPMGIDIRDGAQLECIQCALCIDACDSIMEKIDRPKGLIAYDTTVNLDRGARGEATKMPKILRPRTFVYVTLMAMVAMLMSWALLGRDTLHVNVLPDRQPLFVTLSDGSIRNGYTLKLINREHQDVELLISAEGVDGARLKVVGYDGNNVSVGADSLLSVRVLVEAPKPADERTDMILEVRNPALGVVVPHETAFRGPGS